MPAPVIDETTNVLAYRMGELWSYQPAASNTPTAWTCDGLPDGVTINGTTGKITGPATEPGFFNCTLKASNNGGVDISAPLFLPIAIEAADYALDGSIDLDFDLGTGKITNPNAGNGDPILYAKRGDTLILSIGFKKQGILQPVAVSQLDFCLKEFEGDGVLVLTDGLFNVTGSYDTTRFQIAVYFDPDDVTAPLSSYEGDASTHFDGVGEIRAAFQYLKPGDDPEEPSILERSSINFTVRMVRDLLTTAPTGA
jgi:hypothetical protein